MLGPELDISVVIPVYNAAKSLPELHERICAALNAGFTFEIIYVDDASSDGSAAVLAGIGASCANAVILSHGVNKGQHEAIMTGLARARGRLVANIDDDLQHDPAQIPGLARLLESGGWDIVYAVPKNRDRASEGFLRDMLFRLLFRMDKGLRVGPFRVYTRELGQLVLERARPFNYFSALALIRVRGARRIRACSVGVPYIKRKYGRTNYSVMRKLWIYVRIVYYYHPWRRKWTDRRS